MLKEKAQKVGWESKVDLVKESFKKDTVSVEGGNKLKEVLVVDGSNNGRASVLSLKEMKEGVILVSEKKEGKSCAKEKKASVKLILGDDRPMGVQVC